MSNLDFVIHEILYAVKSKKAVYLDIHLILSNTEKEIFIKSLNSFIQYYSFEVEKLLNGSSDYTLRNHPQHVICDLQNQVKREFLESVNFVQPSDHIIELISNNYDVMLRGKSLFALLTRIVSKKSRSVKHSKASLLEHCYRSHRSEKFVELLEKINQKISA